MDQLYQNTSSGNRGLFLFSQLTVGKFEFISLQIDFVVEADRKGFKSQQKLLHPLIPP